MPSSIQPGPKPTARRSPLSRRSMASRDGFIITRSWMSRQFSPVSFPSSTVTQVPTTNSWWVFPHGEGMGKPGVTQAHTAAVVGTGAALPHQDGALGVVGGDQAGAAQLPSSRVGASVWRAS